MGAKKIVEGAKKKASKSFKDTTRKLSAPSINQPDRSVPSPELLAQQLEAGLTPNSRTGTIDVPYGSSKITPSQLEEMNAALRTEPITLGTAGRTPQAAIELYGADRPILREDIRRTPEFLRPGTDVLLPFLGDRSAVYRLLGYRGANLSQPVNIPGGHDYARQLKSGIWRSGSAVQNKLMDAARAIDSRGYNPVGIYFPMGPEATDGAMFSRQIVDDILRKSKRRKEVSPETLERLADRVRSEKVTTEDKGTIYPYQDFPGFSSRKYGDWMDRSFNNRAAVIDMMGAKAMQDAGMPNVTGLRHAIQDDELRGLPKEGPGFNPYETYGGQMMSYVNTSPRALRSGDRTWLDNPSYPVDMAGDYMGGFSIPVPRSIMFRDFVTSFPSHPKGIQRSMVMRVPPIQKVDQQLIDEAMKWTEGADRLGIMDLLSRYADGGAVQRFDEGGLKRQKSKFAAAASVAKGALGAFRDAPTKKIEDWKWRPLADVPEAQRMAGEPLPAHIHPFGDLMVEQAERADMKGLTPRDLVKAYTLTRSSIQRGALKRATVEETGLPISSSDEMIRPEGAFADWLRTPMGQRYLDAAVKGNIDQSAIDDAMMKMRPFGLHNSLGDDLVYGAKDIPSLAPAASDLVARAYHGKSDPQEWRNLMRGVHGVDASKSGFMSSMLGRGDNPTLDARQLKMHTPDDTKLGVYGRRSSKKLPMTGGDEAVERLAARQRALGLDMPSRFDPMYQHLTHHGMWDASSGTQTTHQDIIDAMRYESGGKVEKDSERFKREADERIAADRAQYDRDIARRREQGGSAPRRFIDQAAKSARTQWSSLDSEGNPVAFWKAGDAPGMLYDVASMPADLTEIFEADIGGNAAGDYSKDASKHMERLRAAIGKETEVAPAKGMIEHAGSSFGNMIGQIPLLPLLPLRAGKQAIDAGIAAAGPLKRAAKTAFEFISPTLAPKFSRNIATGTGIGTGIGYGIEALMGNDEEAQVGYNEGGGVKSKIAPLVNLARGAVRRIGEGTGYRSVPGKPATVEIPTIGRVETLPIPQLEDAAASYMRSIGRPGEHVITEYPEFDEDLARRLARAYDEMKHDPADPRVQRSYQALADETMAQLEKVKDSGLDIRFLKEGMDDPYAKSPALGYADIIENNRLYTFPTDFGFGTTDSNAELLSQFKHPMLTKIGRLGDKDNAVVNDAFRVVHDAFGHFGPGNPFFRHKGEERAWLNHAPMYSPEARPAAAVELRGQNSYLNFGPHAEHNATASGADTVYADQKLGLMPEWAVTEKSKKKPVQKAEGGSVTGSGMNMENKIERAPLPKPETPTFDGMSFEKAFAAARRVNAPRFMWRGKPYTTELKRESARDIERRVERRIPQAPAPQQDEAAVREAEMPSRLYQRPAAQATPAHDAFGPPRPFLSAPEQMDGLMPYEGAAAPRLNPAQMQGTLRRFGRMDMDPSSFAYRFARTMR